MAENPPTSREHQPDKDQADLAARSWTNVYRALKARLPENLREKIRSVSEPLFDSSDIERFSRMEDIRRKGHKLETVLASWETQQREERALRRTYARYLLWILSIQILLINTAFFSIGLKYLEVDRWVATGFIMAVFFEITAMTLVVIKYLFPKVGSDASSLIEKL